MRALIFPLVFLAAPLLAQSDTAHKPIASKLRVYLDCNVCDFDFLRTEITFVDYVRERQDAQVHILVTSQETGGGGSEYTLTFIGQHDLAPLADTLKYVAPPATTQDDLRHGLARMMKLGLVRYAVRIGGSSRFDVSYAPPTDSAAAAKQHDPWNYWVFRSNANGFAQGEKANNFVSLNASQSANRVTEQWKTNLNFYVNYGQNRFDLSDGTTFKSYSHSYGVSDLIVKSLGARWSGGQRASWTSSTYLNQRHAIRFAPTIEFDVFPYSESTRRLWTIQYSTGINYFNYQDTTIFNRISETRVDQTLITSLDLKQPWGSVSSSLEGAVYLHDLSKRHLVFFNSLDLRLFKGFSLFFFGQASLLRDQLYLPKGDLSDADRLLRLRQLATSYTYFMNFGLSYSFGSIFNNIVNPRFGGTSGGFTIIN
jgi:hypothetical protein